MTSFPAQLLKPGSLAISGEFVSFFSFIDQSSLLTLYSGARGHLGYWGWNRADPMQHTPCNTKDYALYY